MERISFREQDTTFGQRMLTLRTSIGLTQEELADRIGVSRRTVTDWEAGNSYPRVDRLKRFIELTMEEQAFRVGHEAEEARRLWKVAHQKVLFDEQWFSSLLGQQQAVYHQEIPASVKETSASTEATHPAAPKPRVDWGDAPTTPTFYGRKSELALLTQWIVQEQYRIVSVLGMGGIGKSSLAVNLIHQVAEHFDSVIFRSLRDAPSCEILLDTCLQTLSPSLLRLVPTSLEQRIDLLLDHLRKVRALVILDNLESILEEGEMKGRFQPGFEGYEVLLRRVAETAHQSCFLLTSREKPTNLRSLEGRQAPVRSLRLSGLDNTACEQILMEKEAVGPPQDQERLAQVYAGNPLALKIVAEIIVDLFRGEIGPFLSERPMLFGSIASLLTEQFDRLSPLEQRVLRWLAISREPVTIEGLLTMLVHPPPRTQLFEAIDSLHRRSLIELGHRQASFTLQSVVLEYVTEELITKMVREIEQGQLNLLIEHGLEQASAKEYVRQAQRRLLLTPILTQLRSKYKKSDKVEEHILSLLHQLRKLEDYAQGYGAANVMALIHQLRGNLRGLDLSQLSIRDTSLQGVEMQDTSLAGATLRDTVFTESLDATWAVAISCTGRYWAAGSKRGEVRVWQEEGQRLYLVWQAHIDNANTIAISPDERTLASGSWDGTVKLWDLSNGALLWTGWHTNLIRSVNFSPDGKTLASCGDDSLIQFWDVATGRNVQVLHHPDPGPVSALAWSPDGSLLASSTLDGSLRLWRVQGTEPLTCLHVLRGHTNWVFALAFSPDSSRLVSGSWDTTAKIWDVESGSLCQTLTGHEKRLYTVAWSPDGRTIASSGFDEMIWLWDVEQNKYRAALHGHTAVVYKVVFTPNSSQLLSCSEDGTFRVWDVESGECIRRIAGYAVSFYDVAWSPDGTRLASAGSDLQVALWDVESRTQPKVLQGHSWTVMGLTWHPDGSILASCGRDNSIRLWDPTTGACLQVLRDPDRPDTLFYDLEWSPKGRLLASGSYVYGVQMWDMTTRTRCWVGREHSTRLRRVSWKPDGTQLVSCGDDGCICLWDATDGALIERIQALDGYVACVQWSPDGTQLASCGGGRGEGVIQVWDMASRKVIKEMRGFSGGFFAVTWNPNGEILISGDSSGSIRWWKVSSGECVAVRQGHTGAVQSLGVSPDERLLASSGNDSTLQLWDMESTELLYTLQRDRPYERLNITETAGLTEAQKATLHILGAVED